MQRTVAKLALGSTDESRGLDLIDAFASIPGLVEHLHKVERRRLGPPEGEARLWEHRLLQPALDLLELRLELRLLLLELLAALLALRHVDQRRAHLPCEVKAKRSYRP